MQTHTVAAKSITHQLHMHVYRPRIAIAGGGPSGLALGLLLHRRGIRPTIYELRDRPIAEEIAKPSGMLDLHEESGLAVMREIGLWAEFKASLGDCSEVMRLFDRNGTLLHATEEQLLIRPEIPRNALTNLLLKNVPSDMIKWNHKIRAAQRVRNASTGAAEIMLDLGDNGTEVYDLVIGADGAWSKLRKLLTDINPFYCGAQWLTATLKHATIKFPRLLEPMALEFFRRWVEVMPSWARDGRKIPYEYMPL